MWCCVVLGAGPVVVQPWVHCRRCLGLTAAQHPVCAKLNVKVPCSLSAQDTGKSRFGVGGPRLVKPGGDGGTATAGEAAAKAAGGEQLSASGADQLAGFTLHDFLPAPWKDLHAKFLKVWTGLLPADLLPQGLAPPGSELSGPFRCSDRACL